MITVNYITNYYDKLPIIYPVCYAVLTPQIHVTNEKQYRKEYFSLMMLFSFEYKQTLGMLSTIVWYEWINYTHGLNVVWNIMKFIIRWFGWFLRCLKYISNFNNAMRHLWKRGREITAIWWEGNTSLEEICDYIEIDVQDCCT